mmetsp:Transcript_6473/g.16527  ORF Transcript_6473/g.16527 Transcript_6473/m.16527 type:complete len:629 (-) Transcript_6473:76-1962(-)
MGQTAGSIVANTWVSEAICTCREPHEFLPAEDCASQDVSPTDLGIDNLDASNVSDNSGQTRALPSSPASHDKVARDSTHSEKESNHPSNPDLSRMGSRMVYQSSQKTDMSVARKRLKGAISAVKACNRMAKTVRFSEETVVCFEVRSEGSSAYKGLAVGDKVIWNDSDDDVPKGTVGSVSGFSVGGIVSVRFPKGTWDFRAAELSTQDSWSTGVARAAIVKADKYMRDLQVLEAESALAEALNKLNEAVDLEKFDDARELTLDAQLNFQAADPESSVQSSAITDINSVTNSGFPTSPTIPTSPLLGGKSLGLQRSNSGRGLPRSNSRDMSGYRSPGLRRASLLSQSEGAEARAAILRMQDNLVYKDVVMRAGQYQALGRALSVEKGDLCYESNGAQLWVHLPAGASWLEYRLMCDLGEVPLTQCCAYNFEPDLQKKPVKGSDKMLKGRGVHPALVVTQAIVSCLACRMEMTVEKFRWYNTEFGFFAESLRSDFPVKDKDEPKAQAKSSGLRSRITVHASQIWMPRGGGQKGTIAVQLFRVDMGSRAARWAASNFASRAAKTLIEELKSSVARAAEKSYVERIASDKLGLYAQLAKVEVAAEKRQVVSIASLPGEEAIKRQCPLPTTWP